MATRPNPLAPWHDEILRTFIAPAIEQTIAAYDITSFASFHKAFQEHTTSLVSSACLAEWCDGLGYSFNRTLSVVGPSNTAAHPGSPESE